MIINEINGDTGEKIGTHARILSQQESSFALRDISYASLNRSPADSEENAAVTPVGNHSPPRQNTPPNTIKNHHHNHHAVLAATTTNPGGPLVAPTTIQPAIPMFQLEVEEPTKLQDVDEGFEDNVYEVTWKYQIFKY